MLLPLTKLTGENNRRTVVMATRDPVSELDWRKLRPFCPYLDALLSL